MGLVLLGFVVGVLSGMFGIGGGFLVTPLLRILVGAPYSIAVGSNLCALIGSASAGVSRHARLGNFEVRTWLVVAAGALSGTYLGAMAHERMEAMLASDAGAVGFDLAMNACFVVFLAGTALLMAVSDTERSAGAERGAAWMRGRYGRIALLCAAGEGVGFVSGLLGVGGGVLLMPILVVVGGLDRRRAVGVSLGAVLCSALIGAARYGLQDPGPLVGRIGQVGSVNVLIAAALLLGGVIGIQLGVRIGQRISGPRFRRLFILLIVLVIIAIGAQSAVLLRRL